MKKIEIEKVLEILSKERPIFHSEKDFQFSLAWKIKSLYPEVAVRLEKPLHRNTDSTEHIDIFLREGAIDIGMELKYITASLIARISEEFFFLKTHAAQDLRCYDVLKDIQRLENYTENEDISIGYSIVLTNVESLWKPKRGEKENYYDEFRIYEGRTVKGKMDWKPETSEGTKKGRTAPINLTGEYSFNWVDYSEVKPIQGSESISKNLFKYVIARIND